MTDDLEDMMSRAVQDVTAQIRSALDTVWASEEGHTIMVAFREGNAQFVITKDGLQVDPIPAELPPDDSGLPGQYL